MLRTQLGLRSPESTQAGGAGLPGRALRKTGQLFVWSLLQPLGVTRFGRFQPNVEGFITKGSSRPFRLALDVPAP